MSTVEILGSLSVGIVVGYVVRYFIRRLEKFTVQALSGVVIVLLGGAAVQFFGDNRELLFVYAIGLFLGFIVLYTAIYVLFGGTVLASPEGITSEPEQNHDAPASDGAGGGSGGGPPPRDALWDD